MTKNCPFNKDKICHFDVYCKNYTCAIESKKEKEIDPDSHTPCHYTADGYCLRDEGDYCPNGQCNCPHLITEINVIATCVTCETTVEMCSNCKKQMTEPKMEC